MIYIYDLLLNWNNSKRYEFFEWDDNDDLEYVKKIPIFKINNFDDVLNNNIRVNKDFLEKIYNKSEIYGNRKSEKIDYACIFCNNVLDKCIAVEFNEYGESIYKSNIYLFDLDDVLVLGNRVKVFDLELEILFCEKNSDIYLTRKEMMKKKYLMEEINSSYRDNNVDKLKYIYYEFFGEEKDDIVLMRDKLMDSLDSNYDYIYDDIYKLIISPNF